MLPGFLLPGEQQGHAADYEFPAGDDILPDRHRTADLIKCSQKICVERSGAVHKCPAEEESGGGPERAGNDLLLLTEKTETSLKREGRKQRKAVSLA